MAFRISMVDRAWVQVRFSVKVSVSVELEDSGEARWIRG